MNKATQTTTESISPASEAILTSILSLSLPEQMKIAALLVERLDAQIDGLEESQTTEILRRSEEVQQGHATLIPGDQAMKLHRDRKKA